MDMLSKQYSAFHCLQCNAQPRHDPIGVPDDRCLSKELPTTLRLLTRPFLYPFAEGVFILARTLQRTFEDIFLQSIYVYCESASTGESNKPFQSIKIP